MSGSSRKLMGTTEAGGAEFLAVEEVFQSWLYTGNGSTQTITNGIDLAGEGGLVWIKSRTSTTSNWLMDTERGMNGVDAFLSSNTLNPAYDASSSGLTPNADGFSHVSGNPDLNASGTNYASWTFRKAPRFFDVVTYTGDGTSARAIPHNLNSQVGFLVVKKTSSADNWYAFHRSMPNPFSYTQPYLRLNDTFPVSSLGDFGTSVNLSDTSNFQVSGAINTNGETYVAYLFAHDPLGPSEDGSDGLIACGSYTGTGAAIDIDLGWEPQWVMVKNASATNNWLIVDNMRGAATGGSDAVLFANTSGTESSFNEIDFTSTGFRENNSVNSGNTYIYIAIRRGPMRQPTSGTEVFAPVFGDGSGTPSIKTSFPVDMGMVTNRASGGGTLVGSRITGAVQLNTSSTSAESSNSFFKFDFQNGWHTWTGVNSGYINWNFRRAPGFFDVVAYSGGSPNNKQISHNLGVAPELIIQKQRDGVSNWNVWCGLAGQYFYGRLNLANPFSNATGPYYFGTHTDTYFSVGYVGYETNVSGTSNIAYLFATLPGVSKVGSYTGNGTNQTINCGFTSGARFILIKRTDASGDWYVWDTERGIVAANDPHLSLNTTTAEVTTDDSVDPDSSGFIVNQVAATNINVSSASYIYLAVS